jgi:hypothetical protein
MSIDLSTYGGLTRAAGYPGQIVDLNPATIESLTNDQAIGIDFGIAVARSAADNTCKAPAADGDKIIGISVRHPIRPADVNGNLVYAQNDSLPILRAGWIYATATENVSRGDQVLSLTAQNGKLSGVTSGAAGAGRVAVPGALWETTTAAGQLGIVRIAN